MARQVTNEPKHHPGRKAPTKEVLLDNAMGMSLGAIAYKYDVAPSSIAQRLRQLDIPPADTRRAFMDFVLSSLSPEIFAWVRTQVSADYPIRQLVVDAIIALHTKEETDEHTTRERAGTHS
jgi:hypothetical protein